MIQHDLLSELKNEVGALAPNLEKVIHILESVWIEARPNWTWQSIWSWRGVAWRLARLVRWGRTHPDLDAELLFTQEEWRGAYVLVRKLPPVTLPCVREVIRQVAMLGGFLGRKSDGEPGVKTQPSGWACSGSGTSCWALSL